MLLAPVPWAKRVWALPVPTAPAPAARHHQERGLRHEKLTDWARPLLRQVRRWLPARGLVVVADSTDAMIALLARCAGLRRPVTRVSRPRLDAALYEPAPPRPSGRRGRPRLKGGRRPALAARLADPRTRWQPVTASTWYGEGPRGVELVSMTAVWYHGGLPPVATRRVLIRDPAGRFGPRALLRADLTIDPAQILAWFILRRQLEVTPGEVRRHLGGETQRQWSDRATRRTTPALLGLFSLVTLLAHRQVLTHPTPARQAAWHPKRAPTSSDARALVRRDPWAHRAASCLSHPDPDMVKVPRALVQRLTDALCYAA